MDVSNTPTNAVREHPSNFHIAIASLEYLAATSLALDLWRHNQLDHFSMMSAKYTNPNFTCEKVLHISLPQCVMKTIDSRICSMGLELQFLYNSLARIGILQNNNNFLQYFDSLACGTDGEISPERTAKNLSTRDELTQWQKFQIACVYWFEDEIRQIWPTVDNHADPNSGQNFELLVCYWMAKMRDSSPDYVPDVDKLLRMIHTVNDFDNWTTFVNVLNKLTLPTLQYEVIDEYAPCNGTKNMLPKLNEAQLSYVLSECPERAIIGLALQNGGFEIAIKIWTLVQESIEFTKFHKILRSLTKRLYNTNVYTNLSRVIHSHAQAVLLEIWTTAPNRLKSELLNDSLVKGLFEYLAEIEFQTSIYLTYDMTFISKLFCDLPTEMRSQIWHDYWPYLVYFSPPKMLNDLLRMSLTNQNYRKFVEKEMMNYEKVRFIMMRWLFDLRYEEVINYTKLCSWNEQLVRKFRKSLLSDTTVSNFDNLFDMGVAIDKCLSNTEAEKTKRAILSSSDGIRLSFVFKLKLGLARKAFSTIDRFLPTERNEREKMLFLDSWGKFILVGRGHPKRYNEFLSWWIYMKDNLPIFKQFLSTDEDFEELLLQRLSTRLDVLKKETSMPSSIGELEEFADVDKFLVFCFDDEAARKIYKRSMISNHRIISRLNNLLYIDGVVNRVIAWFFDNDEIQIARFKNVLFNEKKLLRKFSP